MWHRGGCYRIKCQSLRRVPGAMRGLGVAWGLWDVKCERPARAWGSADRGQVDFEGCWRAGVGTRMGMQG